MRRVGVVVACCGASSCGGRPHWEAWRRGRGLAAALQVFDIYTYMISLERASQEEQSGANFSFIAPSSEEL